MAAGARGRRALRAAAAWAAAWGFVSALWCPLGFAGPAAEPAGIGQRRPWAARGETARRSLALASSGRAEQEEPLIRNSEARARLDGSSLPSVAGSTFRREALLALTGLAPLIKARPASAGVGEGDTLPNGERQEFRIRRALTAWKALRERVEKTDKEPISDEEWKGITQFLRKLYSVQEDMNFISGRLAPDRKKRGEELKDDFKIQVKASDKPAQKKEAANFLVYCKKIEAEMTEFLTLLFDVEDVAIEVKPLVME